MSAGIALGSGILCYMAWGLTHRKPGEKLSVYLIHTRLGVQGAIIGTLAAAMTYQLYTYVLPFSNKLFALVTILFNTGVSVSVAHYLWGSQYPCTRGAGPR
jgi:hypothetical protein